MGLTSIISMLALRSVVDGALDAIEKKTGLPVKDKVEAAFDYLVDHFKDHSGRLGEALTGANQSAWRTLEVALAGESLRTLLDRQEDKAFRAQIREALDANPLNEVVGDDAGFRRSCLAELRDARRQGRLTAEGPLKPNALFQRVSEFARFDGPAELLDAEWAALDQVAGSLRADYPHLALLLTLRPPGDPSPLVVAVRYYFRRAIEQDEALFRSVSWGTIDRISEAQAHGFEALDQHSQRLEALLDEVREIVLDIKDEQNRQGGQLGDIYQTVQKLLERSDRLDRRALRLSDSLSFRNEDERRLVKVLVGRFRALPETRRTQLPALLNALGKLEVVVGDAEEAGRDFRAVAVAVADPRAKAEAHHNAYLAALERRQWAEALDELKRAIALDGPKFAPFPIDKYEPERLLGAGGFGVAFLCRHRYSGARVVIKALMTDDLDRDIAGIFAEANILEDLKHPSIIGLRDCDYVAAAARSRPYLILDHFDGQTLEDYVRDKGPLAVDDFAPLARTVAEALDAAHRRGIWHRDVKPGNVLVRRDERGWSLKLIDFGLALRRTAIDRSIGRDGSLGRSLVGSSVAGSIDYAAPEQMGKQPGVAVGSHSDLFGFGKTCYYVLFGTPNPDYEEIGSLPDPWRKLLVRCVAEKVARRPASFTAILEQWPNTERVPIIPPVQSIPQPVEDPSKTDDSLRDANAYITCGIARKAKGELEQAIADFTEAIRLDPKIPSAYHNRGDALDDQKQYHRALADLDEAIRLDPNRANSFNIRGVVRKNMGNLDRALADYSEAIRLNPKHASAYNNRGSAHKAKGNLDLAIADYSEAIRLDPNYALAYFNRGNALDDQKQYDRAIADYSEAIRLDPMDALACNNRGLTHKAKGELEQAIADFTEAIRLDPKIPSAYHNRGDALDDQKQYHRALADLDEAIRLDPNRANSFNIRGVVRKNMGNLDRALADYSEAIRLDPKHASAYNNRGNAHKAKGNLDQANADFSMAKRLNQGG